MKNSFDIWNSINCTHSCIYNSKVSYTIPLNCVAVIHDSITNIKSHDISFEMIYCCVLPSRYVLSSYNWTNTENPIYLVPFRFNLLNSNQNWFLIYFSFLFPFILVKTKKEEKKNCWQFYCPINNVFNLFQKIKIKIKRIYLAKVYLEWFIFL